MIIEKITIVVKSLVNGFQDNDEDGVTALSGCLDVRPPFQREFVYDEDKQRKVIETILKGFPLNIMYYGVSDIPSRYVLIDGQQRTISICRFVKGDFAINYEGKSYLFSGLPHDLQESILNYELLVFKCQGTESEMLSWFETINIASEPLTHQELRNAVYTGSWLTSSKKYFSKSGCPAVQVGGEYVSGTPIRQEILEEVLKWIADANNKKLEEYMMDHRYDKDATELWQYFNDVINWVRKVFGTGLRDMKSVKWGILYNRYHNKHYVDDQGNIVCTLNGIEQLTTRISLIDEIQKLQDDEEVTSRQGIYEYVLSGDERKLSIRKFPDKIKVKKFKTQEGKCALCDRKFDMNQLVADHILPWSKGGRTEEGNCQLLCVQCNSKKSNKEEAAKDEIYCSTCGKPVVRGRFCQYCGSKN